MDKAVDNPLSLNIPWEDNKKALDAWKKVCNNFKKPCKMKHCPCEIATRIPPRSHRDPTWKKFLLWILKTNSLESHQEKTLHADPGENCGGKKNLGSIPSKNLVLNGKKSCLEILANFVVEMQILMEWHWNKLTLKTSRGWEFSAGILWNTCQKIEFLQCLGDDLKLKFLDLAWSELQYGYQ